MGASRVHSWREKGQDFKACLGGSDIRFGYMGLVGEEVGEREGLPIDIRFSYSTKFLVKKIK